jgi:hypothetical protein
MSDVIMMNVDGREREYRRVMANGVPVLVGYGANLAYADLSGVDLSGLDLSFANLRGAELTFTDLSGCNLSFVDLSDANAIGANIRNANLRGAVTENASLTFADLRGATYDERSVRGAFISDDLTPEYLASLGIGTVDDAKEAVASLSPVEAFDETNPEPATVEADASNAVEPELATDVAPSEFGVGDEGEFVEQLVSSSLLSDLLADSAPGSVAASSRSSLARGGRSRDYSELLEGLSNGIAELTTSEKWTQYLDVQSRFYRYSPSNVMLIMMQNPYASRIGGYKKWKELGRQVMAKESALRILAPMTYKKDGPEGEQTSEIRGWKMVPVFDISQTEGPDLPDIVSKLEGQAPEGVFEKLTVFAESIGFRVERPESLESGANGDTTHSEGRIRVVASNSDAQQAKTLAHEIGHALLHDPESATTKDLTRGLKELEAESAAYVICTALGMDTSDYSFGYVAGWAGGGPEAIAGVKESAGRIQKASTAVLKTFEVEEPSIETVNDSEVEVRSPQLVAQVAVDAERDPTRDHGDPRVDEPTGPVQTQEREVEGPDEQSRVNLVDLVTRDVPTRGYQPLSGSEFDVLSSSTDVELELEI